MGRFAYGMWIKLLKGSGPGTVQVSEKPWKFVVAKKNLWLSVPLFEAAAARM